MDALTPSDNVDIKEEDLEVQQKLVEGAVRGADEGVIEGAEIKGEHSDEENESESDDDDGIVFYTGTTTAGTATKRRTYEKGANVYIRPESTKDKKDASSKGVSSEELKPYRFNYHRTAFDVDINELEETPWRNSNVDQSDYFNYGFNETTWMQYCERQLKHRAELGQGPTPQNSAANTEIESGNKVDS